MQAITGVYLGWIPPEESAWEPLFRTIRVAGGYQSDPTRWYAPRLAQYPGLELALSFNPDPLKLPLKLNRRTPLVRSDYERDAQLLGLNYPITDLLEYVGRTGGSFSGDPFTICPIVEPNDDGNYSYESLLWKFEPEVRDSLTVGDRLKAVISDGKQLIITPDDRVLGELFPYFRILEDAIFNIEFVKIGKQDYSGGGDILLSFDTLVNIYQATNFNLASEVVCV